jgi:hypothetical protein
VQERQLGQGEEHVLIALRRGHRAVQLGNGSRRTLTESFEETALVEHVARRQARLARRDRALIELAKDDLGVDPGRADRARARCQDEAHGAEKREPPARRRAQEQLPAPPRPALVEPGEALDRRRAVLGQRVVPPGPRTQLVDLLEQRKNSTRASAGDASSR